MTPQTLISSKTISFEDLRTLARAEGPCITATIAIPNPAQIETQVKNAVREVEKHLGNLQIEPATARTLLEPIEALAARIETEGDWGFGLVLYRSPELFRYFALPKPGREFVTVENCFQIRPLLGWLSRVQEFYLLALSEKHVHLFRCEHDSVETLPSPARMPGSLQAWLKDRKPDHVLDDRSGAGPSSGSMAGVQFSTNSDRDRHHEFLAHFFREVDHGLHPFLVNQTVPLMLAAVERDIEIYKRVNSYPQLMQAAVHGSPDGSSPRGLHQRALKIARQTLSAPLQKATKELEQYLGTKLVSLDTPQILKGAQEGRVSYLLLREDEEYGNDDPLNLAAVATLADRGEVFGVETSELPIGAEAAAVFRF